jgi:hypothetical protein
MTLEWRRAMDLDAIRTSLDGASDRMSEVLHGLPHLFDGQGARHGDVLHPIWREYLRAWSHGRWSHALAMVGRRRSSCLCRASGPWSGLFG